MKLRFTKMHGLGNDFVVVDAVNQPLPEDGPPFPVGELRRLADRHFGIGFDQLLVVQPPRRAGSDFRYRIFNADGSEVSQCGNGARCFARFVREQGLTDKDDVVVDTTAGRMTLHITAKGLVRVDMGTPQWLPPRVPFNARQEADSYTLVAGAATYEASVVGLGNPHCVLWTDDVDRAPVTTVGPILESHERFPERTNVGFMQIIRRNEIRLRVFERGAGETLACGSGACAAVLCGQRRGFLDESVTVHLRGGSLQVDHTPGGNVRMTGPASHVYDGEVEIQAQDTAP